MIFLNKFLSAAASALLIASVLGGCGDKKHSSKSKPSSSENVTEAAAEAMTEPITENQTTSPQTPIRDLAPAKGSYVYDNANLLSAEDISALNSYCEWLYENRLINTAVVTVNDLGGASPAEYAENSYIDIYSGRGSGMLLLINNDTNKDYLYKKGSCTSYIDESAETLAFCLATREIVNGNYQSAALSIMMLGEACPSYVFDNGGIFTPEQLSELEAFCKDSGMNVSILATSNSTGSSNEEICKSYHDRRYSSEKGFMIMADTASGTLAVVPSDELPPAALAALSDANKPAAEKDYISAIKTVINAMK